MTDDHTNPDRSGNEFDLGTLIRCAADDNLSMEQADTLRTHLSSHPEDQARIDFERRLRTAVATAMRTEPATTEFRQSIEAMLAADRNTGTIGPAATTDRSFWRRAFVPAAVAAVLLLAFGVSMIISNQTSSATWSDGLSASVVSWVDREHNKCSDSVEYRERKLKVTNVADAQEATLHDLGATPRTIHLENAGYTFAGYGSCKIPGGGASGQLIFTPNNGVGEPISLFIQRDNGLLDGIAGASDCLKGIVGDGPTKDDRYGTANAGGNNGDQIYIWRADGLIYYLVTKRSNEAMPCLKSLGAPENHISL